MPTANQTYSIRGKKAPSLPVDAPVFEPRPEHHRKETDVPIDYQMQTDDEGKRVYMRKPDVQRYSGIFNLNGQIDIVRDYINEIGAVQVKSSSPETHEELYLKSPGFIGIHPSLNSVSLSGIEKEILDGFEKILGGKK